MANRYRVGGGTHPYNNTTYWSTTSGGAGGASVPGSGDDAFIDGNSGANVNIVIGNDSCHNIDFTGANNPTLDLGPSGNLDVYGSVKFIPSLTPLNFGTIRFRASGIVNLDFAGLDMITSLWIFELYVPATGTYNLQSDMNIYVFNWNSDGAGGATLNTNNHNISSKSFNQGRQGSFDGMTLNAGSSTIELIYDDNYQSYGEFDSNFNRGTSTIILNGGYIICDNCHLATLNIVGTIPIRHGLALGSNSTLVTIDTLNQDAGTDLSPDLNFFGSFSIGDWNAIGTSVDHISTHADGTPDQFGFEITGTANLAYVELQGCFASGNIPIYDPNGVDNGDNVNVVFSEPPAPTPYFTQDPLPEGTDDTCVTIEGFVPDCTGVTEFGIVYSNNNENPTIFDTLITYTCNQGDFSFVICNLIPGERYVFGIYTRSGSGLINYYDYRSININALIKKKRYYYKVYDSITGVYITTWSIDVVSDPNFRMVINGGAGELKIRLGRTYSNFNEGVDVKLNNRVECWCMDRDNPEGTKIYTGYISAYSPVIDDEDQYVDVTLLGFATRLAVHPLRDAASGLTTITYSSVEPATIMKDLIDKYHDDGGTDVFYTNVSIQNTNTVASYTFINNTLQEAVDKIIELTPENWFWYIDANSIIFLQPSNIAHPDHKLTIGKDLAFLSSNKRLENMTNAVTVIGGGSPTPLYNYYRRPSSIALYGKWEKRLQDGRVTSNATSDLMAKRQLDRFDTPEYRTTLKIIDNNGENQLQGADIEHFFPGETIQVVNLPNSPILIIQSINYTPHYIEIEAATRLPEISKDFTYLNRNVITTAQTDLPTTPSERTV